MERTLKPEILSVRLIANVHPDMAKSLELLPGEKSLALFTCNIDDPLYIGGDEATKKADVRVAYCRSHFAGGSYPSGPLSGEAMLLLAAPNPAEATAGINAVLEFVDALRYSTVTLPVCPRKPGSLPGPLSHTSLPRPLRATMRWSVP
jgi:ethanolamine utilization protein EutL